MLGVARRTALTATALGLLALAAGRTAHADLSLSINRTALNASDSVDWLSAGVDGSIPNSPLSVSTLGGIPLLVSDGNAHSFVRLVEGSDWEGSLGGNFTVGNNVLYNSAWGAISVSSATGFAKIGAQIQSLTFGTFVARISAYDAQQNLLASFTEAGVSNSNKNGSAIFIGVEGTGLGDPSIATIVFSLDSASGGFPERFAINGLSLSPFTAAAVPEPSTLLSWVTAGLLGLGYTLRRRKAAKATA
jgi:hypothetical protein